MRQPLRTRADAPQGRDAAPAAPARAREPWLLARGARTLWADLRTDLRTVPGAAWWRAGLILVLGGLSTCAWTAGLTFWVRAWAARGLEAWDLAGLRWIEEGPLGFPAATVFESPGNLAYLAPLVALCAVLAIRRGSAPVALALVASYGVARGFVFLGWGLWERARPDLIAEGLAAPGLHSFPSGHAALSLSVWGFLGYLWARASPRWGERALAALGVGALLALVGWSRVRMGTHWPSDIVGGWLIGAAWLLVVILALRTVERARTSPA